MLVLNRQLQQRIRIGDDIVITVVRLSKMRVAIGIDAPKGIDIQREEIYLAGGNRRDSDPGGK